MPTPPYPLRPEPLEKSWLEKNPRWKIPLGGLILLLLIGISGGIVMTVVVTSFRSSDVYQQATDLAQNNAQVRDELGEPIKFGWLISGQLNSAGSTGHANLSIPVSGPNRRGAVHAVAFKAAGTWKFTLLIVMVDGEPDINLMPMN